MAHLDFCDEEKMRLLNFLRPQKSVFKLEITMPTVLEQVETIDNRKAECPTCYKKLAKIPGAKTKCHHCGEYMYVRTQVNHTRVVVTKAQAEEIEKQWMIAKGTYDSYLAEKASFAAEKEEIATKLGRQPSDNDVRWRRLNRELMSHAKRGDWGLYRNARFSMAEILLSEKRLEAALYTYLEVCYLDLNGPRNMGGITDKYIINEFPPFNQKFASLAGGVTSRIVNIMKHLDVTLSDIKPKFLEQNDNTGKTLKLPLSAGKAWSSLIEDSTFAQQLLKM
jgi:hypothetical protein